MPPKAVLSQVIVTRRQRAKPNQLPGESAAEQERQEDWELVHIMPAVGATAWHRAVTNMIEIARLRGVWGIIGHFLNAIKQRGVQEAAAAASRGQ